MKMRRSPTGTGTPQVNGFLGYRFMQIGFGSAKLPQDPKFLTEEENESGK